MKKIKKINTYFNKKQMLECMKYKCNWEYTYTTLAELKQDFNKCFHSDDEEELFYNNDFLKEGLKYENWSTVFNKINWTYYNEEYMDEYWVIHY